MIQKKYLCRDVSETKEAVRQIRSVVGMLKDCGDEDLLIAEISVALVADLMPEGCGIPLNLILTEKGSVTLSVKNAGISKKKIRLCISVKDTGIGIRPEDMERLFDEYSRF